MDWVWYLLLLAVLISGLAITVIGLPGLWLMIGAVGVYAWGTGWTQVALVTVIALVGVGILAELVEFLAGGAAAKKAGGSARSAWGALIGGVAGALLFSIPVPIVGTIIGACLGAFIGALAMEYSVRQHTEHSMRVGWAAAKGRLWGILSKLAFGVVILLVAMWTACPGFTGAATAPATQPTTQQ